MKKLLFIFLIFFVSNLKVNAKETYAMRYCYENSSDFGEDKIWTKKKYDKAFSYLLFDRSSYLEYLVMEGVKAKEKIEEDDERIGEYEWLLKTYEKEYVKVSNENNDSVYIIGNKTVGIIQDGLLNFNNEDIQDAIDVGGQLKRMVDMNRFIINPADSSITHAVVFTIEFIKDFSSTVGDNDQQFKKDIAESRRTFNKFKITDIQDNTFFAERPSFKQKLFLDTINRSVEIDYPKTSIGPAKTKKWVCEIPENVPKKTGLWIVIFLALISYFVYSHTVKSTKKVKRRKN